jgi:hypothetical protein
VGVKIGTQIGTDGGARGLGGVVLGHQGEHAVDGDTSELEVRVAEQQRVVEQHREPERAERGAAEGRAGVGRQRLERRAAVLER